ncbi:MAG: DNA repair protein RadA [Candidatus Schekmanbacteria bacterium]|nr:MAG: DNA repair protein RadA [Candidatus Schekmanbacteria bacterium]
MKERKFYQCQSCGYQSAKWLGKCPDCNEWNSFVEERETSVRRTTFKLPSLDSKSKPLSFRDIKQNEEARIKTGIGEFDRVLGGGLVSGSTILIGGSPGIGKSTLLLQALDALSENGLNCLYISGEESPSQIKLRAERLGLKAEKILVLSENCYEIIKDHITKIKPNAVVIDSIQTVYTSQLPSSPGSLSQLREVAGLLMFLAKSMGMPVIFTGHVTKDGSIAGPRVLEHIVDAVLYIEGDSGNYYRILRTAKNRFGSTNEIGIFEMREEGMVEVKNPSSIFLSEKSEEVAGSAVVCAIEGTRPILLEVQALVSHSSFGIPQRVTKGLNARRTSILTAVLEKKVGMRLSQEDIFINVVGGAEIDDPSADLGTVIAIISSFRDKPVKKRTVFTGEVGLTGEIRAVNRIELQINEAEKLGFERIFVPSANMKSLAVKNSIKIIEVDNIKDAVNDAF